MSEKRRNRNEIAVYMISSAPTTLLRMAANIRRNSRLGCSFRSLRSTLLLSCMNAAAVGDGAGVERKKFNEQNSLECTEKRLHGRRHLRLGLNVNANSIVVFSADVISAVSCRIAADFSMSVSWHRLTFRTKIRYREAIRLIGNAKRLHRNQRTTWHLLDVIYWDEGQALSPLCTPLR